ncbi:hypothetical protein L3Q82_023169 [Scortum barcoo]|uniref:Uncharacterized protein n=1 Tax=Scortum barcoo TaxID=214431 RepID=A0ACB8WY94_9TELE|nr:hypothetical protein L3Q82_023169 [Scortum barcoo]
MTHDCVATHSSNTIIKFADDTDRHRPDHRRRREGLQRGGGGRERNTPPSPSTGLRWRESTASGSSGFHISREDLTWTHHTDFITKSAQQRLFFLCRLQRLNMDSRILCSFYRCTIERILTGCITAWYSSCTALNRKALQRVVKAAQLTAHHQDGAAIHGGPLHPAAV